MVDLPWPAPGPDDEPGPAGSVEEPAVGEPAVEEFVALYRSAAAAQLYDEVVTEAEHALQCAALADADGAPPALVVAALLHDVGHLLVGDHVPIEAELACDARHEEVGAEWLDRRFGEAVSAPVRLHVQAKRYLCAVEPGYRGQLSASSLRSLVLQGRGMGDSEVAAFMADPHCASAVALRRWDDAAKVPDLDPPGIETYVPLLESLALR